MRPEVDARRCPGRCRRRTAGGGPESRAMRQAARRGRASSSMRPPSSCRASPRPTSTRPRSAGLAAARAAQRGFEHARAPRPCGRRPPARCRQRHAPAPRLRRPSPGMARTAAASSTPTPERPAQPQRRPRALQRADGAFGLAPRDRAAARHHAGCRARRSRRRRRALRSERGEVGAVPRLRRAQRLRPAAGDSALGRAGARPRTPAR